MSFAHSFLLSVLILAAVVSRAGDWPMLRRSAAHTGFTPEQVEEPFRLSWAVEFENERIGTAVEPIVADGRVFVATQAGSLFALEARTGRALWRVAGSGPYLHSPGVSGSFVVAGNAHGTVCWIDSASGEIRSVFHGPAGGFAAAPVIAADVIFIGSRSGELFCFTAGGELVWRKKLPAPIRQTAACDKEAVYVTSEDLRLRAFDRKGNLLWTAEPMPGQTARDYYPVVFERGGRTFVAVRTNPLRTMSQRIGRDRTMLARSAGFDDSGWQKVDAWTSRADWRGTPELWEKEQAAIVDYLEETPDAANFFMFDARDGKRAATPPILWASGCQSAGAPPALTRGGDLFVLYRSAYGNWNHGVAPLVALGLFDPAKNRMAPVFHEFGNKPPWNTFWGTADESQNFVIAGDTALIIHQGTLSGFNLKENKLFKIHGERDTFGGFRPPPWARNEWHGPARSGVAISNGRIFWQTGSRILCLVSGESGAPARLETIEPGAVKTMAAPNARVRSRDELRAELNRVAEEILSDRWMPLFVDPGLNGREFFFGQSSDYFAAFAEAHRFLNPENKKGASDFLAEELVKHPPFSASGYYPLKEGKPREWFSVPAELRSGEGTRAHPFGGLAAAAQWARNTGHEELLLAQWKTIQEAYRDFDSSNWRLDPQKGDLHANRYVASLQAYARLAHGEAERERASAKAELERRNLIAWWTNAAPAGTLRSFDGVKELDPFIGQGDAISFRVAPHRHKIALFREITPELFRTVLEAEAAEFREVWAAFNSLYRTWPLMGEERQVHFGENFVDTPELALDAYKALAWLPETSWEALSAAVDLPSCRADVFYLHKLALALAHLDSSGSSRARRKPSP